VTEKEQQELLAQVECVEHALGEVIRAQKALHDILNAPLPKKGESDYARIARERYLSGV
jgi:hypothetical protein